MTQVEYWTALISIIVGLGVTDLARSFRELIRPGRPVRWHWLPLMWAAFTLLLIVQIWWNSFDFFQRSEGSAFLVSIFTFLLLYLSCAFALPDPAWGGRDDIAGASAGSGDNRPAGGELDLRAFYFSARHRRWFFGTLAVFAIVAEVVTQTLMEPADWKESLALNAGLTGILVTLGVTDRRWVHATASVVAFGVNAMTTLGSVLR